MSGTLVFTDGRRVPVRDGLVLGRVAPADVVIDDSKASRRHARLIVAGAVVELEDLDSSNGTLLNGKRITRRLLRDGDEIRIGSTDVVFREQPAPPPTPPHAVLPGEDLLGGADDLPGVGLEGDPLQARRSPAPASPPPSAPRLPAPAATRGVERLEFADDEVIEVRRRETPLPRTASPGTTPRAVSRDRGALQFSAKPEQGGLFRDDLGQMSRPLRWSLVLLAIAAAGGLGWLAMWLVR